MGFGGLDQARGGAHGLGEDGIVVGGEGIAGEGGIHVPGLSQDHVQQAALQGREALEAVDQHDFFPEEAAFPRLIGGAVQGIPGIGQGVLHSLLVEGKERREVPQLVPQQPRAGRGELR